MRLRTRVLAMCVAIIGAMHLGLMPASAQRGGKDGANWELLGETVVGYGADRDLISVGRPDDHFKDRAYTRLRLTAERGEFKMRSMKVRYINGFEEEFDVNRSMSAGQEIVVDLPGRRSFLSQIELNYGAKVGFTFGSGGISFNRPIVRVYGDNRGGGVGPSDRRPEPLGAGWEEIGDTQVGSGDDEATIRVGRREGRFGQIRVRNEGRPMILRNMTVRFGNGETQVVRLNERMDRGELTRAIDVDGSRRYIDRIVFKFDTLRGGGRTKLSAYGLDRPGREVTPPSRPDPLGAGWEEIGRTGIEPGDDETTIRVGRKEGRFGQIRIKNDGRPMNLRRLRVVFGNGQTQDVPLNERMSPGELTRAIDVDGNTRFINQIVFFFDRMDRPGRSSELVVYGLDRAPGQRGDNNRGGNDGRGDGRRAGWVALGEQKVGFRVERDVIRVSQSADWQAKNAFDKLHIVVADNDIYMNGILVKYQNGFTEDFQIGREIKDGQDLLVDLRGRRAYISEIELNYRAKPSFAGRASVTVYGEPAK